MPRYDFRCLRCQRRFDVFLTYAEYGVKSIACPHCGSGEVQRRMNKVRIARSDSSRLESIASPENMEALEDDPRALGRMMREMRGEIGDEMGPEFDEVVNRLEAGQSPDQIEKDLPDLGAGDFGDAAGSPADPGGDFDD